MPGTMSKADLITDLIASLMDSAEIFTADSDADFIRHLNNAALDMGRFRMRTLVGSITLVADQPNYPAPADLLRPKSAIWGTNSAYSRKPWLRQHAGPIPTVHLVGPELHLDPAPTAQQIAKLGADFKYFYFAGHTIATESAETTIHVGDRGLLLLRAQVEALQEIAIRNSGKPVSMQDGVSGAPKNGTPAALSEQLMERFENMAAA